MYCNKCGTYLPDEADFCPYCGAPAAKQTQQVIIAPAHGNKNTIVAGAIIAVVVVLIFAIGCFTFLTKRSQDVQLEAAQAARQSDISSTDNSAAAKTKTTDTSTSAEQQSSSPVDMPTSRSTAGNGQNSDTSDTKESSGQTSSTTTVTNNYYYYGTNAAQDDEYYTHSQDFDYLWPTDSQYISTSDLSIMNRNTVAAIRNEIYARHGYAFSTARWQDYFAGKSWYYRDETCTENTIMARLSSIERANISTIISYEESQGWR